MFRGFACTSMPYKTHTTHIILYLLYVILSKIFKWVGKFCINVLSCCWNIAFIHGTVSWEYAFNGAYIYTVVPKFTFIYFARFDSITFLILCSFVFSIIPNEYLRHNFIIYDSRKRSFFSFFCFSLFQSTYSICFHRADLFHCDNLFMLFFFIFLFFFYFSHSS